MKFSTLVVGFLVLNVTANAECGKRFLLNNGLILVPAAKGFYLMNNKRMDYYSLPKIDFKEGSPEGLVEWKDPNGRTVRFEGGKLFRSAAGKVFLNATGELKQLTHLTGSTNVSMQDVLDSRKMNSSTILIPRNVIDEAQEAYVIQHPTEGRMYFSYLRSLPIRKENHLIQYTAKPDFTSFKVLKGMQLTSEEAKQALKRRANELAMCQRAPVQTAQNLFEE